MVHVVLAFMFIVKNAYFCAKLPVMTAASQSQENKKGVTLEEVYWKVETVQ